MSNRQQREKSLVQKLRLQCTSDGKEINEKQTAKILYQLGLIYKEKGHRIELIQSAALLNAALVRDPDNKQDIKNDLQQLCGFILEKANSKNPEKVCLITAAYEIKKDIQVMRNFVNKDLKKLEHISENIAGPKLIELEINKVNEIKKIQNYVTDEYKSIMKNLSNICAKILGNPPCEFALVGMGSLARKEITPYSDFECAIVLEEGVQNQNEAYSRILEYFRWYAVIFQVILINLGETLIPSVAIPSLNDFTVPGGDWFYDAFTPSGVCFDGMMPHACKTPLGRQETKLKPWKTELIKPTNKLVKYLSSDENLKNGYNLADILSKICFVSGNQTVYKSFEREADKMMLENKRDGTDFFWGIKRQVEEDLEKFDVNNQIEAAYESEKINIKSAMYRCTTIFISAFGKLLDIKASSSFDIINSLFEKDIITKNLEHELKYAVAVACEIRLKTYSKYERQRDLISFSKASMTEFVGRKCLISYLLFAARLQMSVPFNFSIQNVSDQKIIIRSLGYLDPFYQTFIYFYLHMYEECIDYCQRDLEKSDTCLRDENKSYIFHLMGGSWLKLNKPVKAQEVFEQGLSIQDNLFPKNNFISFSEKCRFNYKIGLCLMNQGKFLDAIQTFRKALSIEKFGRHTYQASSVDEVKIKLGIAMCLNKENRFSEVLDHIQNSGLMDCILSNQANKTPYLEKSCNELVYCMKNMNMFENFKQKEHNLNFKENSYDIEICQFDIGLKLMEFSLEMAINKFTNALDVLKQRSDDNVKDAIIAKCYHQIGVCLIKQNHYKKALLHFELENSILQTIKTNDVFDYCKCCYYMGISFYHLKYYKRALNQFNNLLIKEHLTQQNEMFPLNFHRYVGKTLFKLKQYENALQHFVSDVEKASYCNIEAHHI